MRVPNRLIRIFVVNVPHLTGAVHFFCALFQQVKGKVKTLLKTVKIVKVLLTISKTFGEIVDKERTEEVRKFVVRC